jgi:hypothetical protein
MKNCCSYLYYLVPVRQNPLTWDSRGVDSPAVGRTATLREEAVALFPVIGISTGALRT